MSNSDTHGATAPAGTLPDLSISRLPTPKQADLSAALCLEQSGALVRCREMMRDPERADHLFVTVYREQGVGLVYLYLRKDADRDKLQRARNEIMAICQPLGRADLIKAVSKCWALCKQRSQSEDDLVMSISAFVDKLATYPADAVADVLARWPDGNKFTPSWAELKEDLTLVTLKRKQMLKAIDALIQ